MPILQLEKLKFFLISKKELLNMKSEKKKKS